jgi:hypothetical protein
MASPSKKAEDTSNPSSVRGRSDPLRAGKITAAAKGANQNTAPTFPNTLSVTDITDSNTQAIVTTPSTEQDVTVKPDSSASATKQDCGTFRAGSRTPISVMTVEQREAFRLREHARRSEAASRTCSTVRGPRRTSEEKQAEFFRKAQLPPKLEERFRDKFAKREAERQQLARDKEAQSTASIPDPRALALTAGRTHRR